MAAGSRVTPGMLVDVARRHFLDGVRYSPRYAFYAFMSKVFDVRRSRSSLGYFFLHQKHLSIRRWIAHHHGSLIREYVDADGLTRGSLTQAAPMKTSATPDSKTTAVCPRESQDRVPLSKASSLPTETRLNDGPIWVFWWQGEEQAPDVVKACLASTRRHSAGRDVVLLSQANYGEYVELPDYILRKLAKGEMSKNQFANVLRVTLLAQRGGAWLDATVFLSGPLDAEIFTREFYTARIRYTAPHPFDYAKWTTFFLAGAKGNVLFCFLRDFYFAHWASASGQIDYFMFDHAIRVAYEMIPAVRLMVDQVPYNNQEILTLQRVLNSPFDEAYYQWCAQDTYLHKLTWKTSLSPVTEHNDMTFFGFIMAGSERAA